MTNPDNVGGLLSRVREALVSCTEYRVGSPAYEQIVAAIDRAELCRASGDAGGLPELPEPTHILCSGCAWHCGSGYTADQVRAYGELCRAAPAGGDVTGLHPATADLVARFAAALAEKLVAAERKYGYSDGWASPDWMDECRAKLMEHIAKGDPRDVAAYCAFLWHHGESTAPAKDSATAGSGEVGALIDRLESAAGAYPEDVFPALTSEERALHGMVIQLASAAMGRHMAPMLLEAAAILRKLQQGADGWRPIESAPRDGSRVIVASYSKNMDEWLVTEGWWATPHEYAGLRQCYWMYKGNRVMLDASIHDGLGASHWQPLPEAPASQDQEGDHAED